MKLKVNYITAITNNDCSKARNILPLVSNIRIESNLFFFTNAPIDILLGVNDDKITQFTR